ncbi:hypothetical protein FYZ48_15100 [Gimesia chilikensis]|uniref:hypothetical protein n=1 Tax=Gimesia chilikensis TaxID=2605989 RepID=UPI0011ECEE35|nr:hypothetical protein [Gimesia chilikensis]KAA0137994.1 hypothetical protein FYZ48_15100 [Gimesia chilikensis]
MKILSLDPYEFESSSSEEFLVIAIANAKQFPDWEAFFQATIESGAFEPRESPFPAQPIAFQDFEYADSVRIYLQRYAGVVPEGTASSIPLACEWYEQEILIEERGTFIRYAWETSA